MVTLSRQYCEDSGATWVGETGRPGAGTGSAGRPKLHHKDNRSKKNSILNLQGCWSLSQSRTKKTAPAPTPTPTVNIYFYRTLMLSYLWFVFLFLEVGVGKRTRTRSRRTKSRRMRRRRTMTQRTRTPRGGWQGGEQGQWGQWGGCWVEGEGREREGVGAGILMEPEFDWSLSQKFQKCWMLISFPD